jgi:predicted ferric reductase
MSVKTKKLLLIFFFLISFLPLLEVLQTPRYSNIGTLDSERDLRLYFGLAGSIFGFIGMIMLWWQSVLGFRKVLGPWIQDVPWLLDIHKKIGMYGTLLIFLHPLFAALRFGFDEFIGVILPSFGTEYERHIFLGSIALYILAIIWISSAILRSRIKYRPWRYIHYLSFAVVPLVFLHGGSIGHSLGNSDLLMLYWNIILGSYLALLLFRFAYQIGLGKKKYLLESKKQLTDSTFEYTFAPKSVDKQISYYPGAYVHLQLGKIGEDHPFTITQFDSSTGNLSFGIKTFGKFTKKIENLEVGSEVLIDGPYGVFTREIYSEPDRNSIMIAGGIGITPFINAIKTKDPSSIFLFYGNEDSEQIAYKKLIDEKLNENIVHVISSDRDGTIPENYEVGYITKDILEKHLPKDFENNNFFICGPVPMMKLVEKSLTELGVAKSNIHTEKFGY